MCQVMLVTNGPSVAELMRASEWSGTQQRPVLMFTLGDFQQVESVDYTIGLIDSETFLISLLTTNDAELEINWKPGKKTGRCILALANR